MVIAELEKLCIVHLFTLGFRDSDLLSFKLSLNNPSKLAELQELEHLRTKFDIFVARDIRPFLPNISAQISRAAAFFGPYICSLCLVNIHDHHLLDS